MTQNEKESIKNVAKAMGNLTNNDTSRPYYSVGYSKCKNECIVILKKAFPEVFNNGNKGPKVGR